MTTYANVGHILLKRGNTTQSTAYTGPVGELTFDTDLGTIRVHNNAVAGGVAILATQAQVNLINANLVSAVGTISNSISTISGIDAAFAANINLLLANAVSQQSTINTTSANLALFQTYANTTISTLQSNAGVQADAITSLRANITASNLAIAAATGTYGNANVAGYLPTYTGSIAGNIAKNGYTWTFGADGDLYIPPGSTIRNAMTGDDLLADSNATLLEPYKGFRAHYGTMYNNTDDENGPINKLVIYKSTVTPASAIDTSTSSDDFQVTGLTGSDVVAMLVVVTDGTDWDVQTPTATLKTFVEKIIDEVILDGGVEGDVNTVSAMRTAFYANFSNFNTVIPNVKADLEFFSINNQFNISPQYTTGKGATFSGISYNMADDTLDLGSWGQSIGTHTVGDVFVITGNTIQDADSNFLTTPTNDVTVTITGESSGYISTFTVTGTLPRPAEIWPSTSISDGGDDEYDGANAIHTNLETEIIYNSGAPIFNATAFGGGDYVVTYQAGIFGIFAIDADINILGTSGDSGGYGNDTSSSGFDGDGIAVTGSLYGNVSAPATISEITNTDPAGPTYSVSVANTGVITMTTARGGLEFGAMPEPGGPTHFHVMRPASDNGTDLYFGDDYNYVLQRPAAYGGAPAYGVEIGANDNNGGDQQVWRFGTDGTTFFPDGTNFGNINGVGTIGFAASPGSAFTIGTIGGSWQFGADGNLTLPSGGTIDDAVGIKLTPAGGANAGQALVIYPTAGAEGDHIHMAAYGATTELYLGTDNHYVKLVNGGNVQIQAHDLASNAAVWTFGTDGNLTLPETGYLQVGRGIVAGFASSPAPIISGFSSISAVNLGASGNVLASGQVIANGVIESGTGFSTGGYLSVDGSTDLHNTTVTGNIGATGNINASQFNFANGVNILSTVSSSSTYSNANVATFLASLGSNTISTSGNVTAGKFIGDGSSLSNVTISLAGNVVGTQPNVTLVAGSYTYTFDNGGTLTMPAAGGNEGAEINFVKAPNSSLSGTAVVVDQYVDRMRIFENSGTNRGVYIDLTQAGAGVSTLLNNRVAAFVDSGTFVTMDNIKATVTTSGSRGLSLATVSGSFTYNIGGNYSWATNATVGGATAGTQTLTTTPTAAIFGWSFPNQGDLSTYILTNTSSMQAYRITVMMGAGYLNNMICIERLI